MIIDHYHVIVGDLTNAGCTLCRPGVEYSEDLPCVIVDRNIQVVPIIRTAKGAQHTTYIDALALSVHDSVGTVQ